MSIIPYYYYPRYPKEKIFKKIHKEFFYKNHKKTIEIAYAFVYNVFIAVKFTAAHERRMNIYVHCKCYSQRLLAGTQRQR